MLGNGCQGNPLFLSMGVLARAASIRWYFVGRRLTMPQRGVWLGMHALFSLTILVEPDRHRFARLALEAVRALAGNAFFAAPRLAETVRNLREECGRTGGAVTACVQVDGDRVEAACGSRRLLLAQLPREPAFSDLTELSARLRQSGESADPELLMRRNREVSRQLERAKARAAVEMAELEAMLERKKEELRETLHRAETDGLTGLLNRRAYDRHLREAVTRSHRQHQPLSLLLLDLDHFKDINDAHGHQYGDAYLKRMADSLRRAARDGVDHACRFGGDEFAVIAFGDLKAAAGIAHRALQMMDNRISVGIAELDEGEQAEQLIARADAALYRAKREGRGRIIFAADQALFCSEAVG